MNFLSLLLGAAAPLVLVAIGIALFRALTIQVEDEHAALVTRFGKLVRVIREPGLHVQLDRFLPWVAVKHVSLARDFREFVDVHVHDAQGTMVLVDLWLELRVEDPVRATFAVADWDRALRNLVSHAVTSIFGNRQFDEILRCRVELGAMLKEEIGDDLERWGIRVEQAYLRNIGLRPEVDRQILGSVAARLERAKADIDERGRIAVAHLEAETSVRIAELVAKAKGQYPEAIGRAYQTMTERPAVRAAYDELYALAQLRPQRTIALVGFGDGGGGDVRAIEALMMSGDAGGSALTKPAGSSAAHGTNGTNGSAHVHAASQARPRAGCC